MGCSAWTVIWAPLGALARLAKAHDAWLMVDDAHGLGVLGEHGGGSLEQFGLDAADVPILMGTLGKGPGQLWRLCRR